MILPRHRILMLEGEVKMLTESRAAFSAMFDAIETECWSLKCVSYSNGAAGDADVGWEVVSHHMAKPHERVEGRGSTPIAAINDAMSDGDEVADGWLADGSWKP